MSAEAGMDGVGRGAAMSVAEAKARLREWGAGADEAQRLMLEAARDRARKATPYAALAAGVLGLLSAGGLLRRGKRRRDQDEVGRSSGMDGLVPLVLAGMRLAPLVMGMMERGASKRAARRKGEAEEA